MLELQFYYLKFDKGSILGKLIKFHLLKVDWWFGHSFICIFEKNKPSIISVSNKRIYCDICNNRCKRGRGGRGMNECSNTPL